MAILQVFTLLGALGMNLMSSGIQKASGDKLRGFLTAMTSNPFKGGYSISRRSWSGLLQIRIVNN